MIGFAPKSRVTKVPAPRRRLDETFAFEFGECAADCRARNPVPGGQRLLAGKETVVFQPSARDAVAQEQIKLARLGGFDAGHSPHLYQKDL